MTTAIRNLWPAESRKATGLGKNAGVQTQAKGRFPGSAKITAQTVGCVEHEVQA
jgi:hypothetical protein